MLQAIKIALNLKKWLVDNQRFQIQQSELEQLIFRFLRLEVRRFSFLYHHMYNCMTRFPTSPLHLTWQGFGDEEISRFKLVNKFQQTRNPLIIILSGLSCSTKTNIAQLLSQRIHLPNVLRTDALEDMLRHHPEAHMSQPSSIWDCSLTQQECLHIFQKDCQVVRKAIQGDLEKAFVDGKSIIVEGFHLDPAQYSNLGLDMKERSTHDVVTIVSSDHGKMKSTSDTPSHHVALVIPLHIQISRHRATDTESWVSDICSPNLSHPPSSAELSVLNVIDEYMATYCKDHGIPCFEADVLDPQACLDSLHEWILNAIESNAVDQ